MFPEHSGGSGRKKFGSDKSAGTTKEASSSNNAAEKSSKPKNAAEIESIKKKLIEGAETYKGAKSLVINGRRFNMDCSGVVSAIYYYAGIDFSKYYTDLNGTGTEIIYKSLKDKKLLKKTWLPEPGDVIFWDNTFDRNKNNKDDDALTHMGMVVSCDKQGNITYVHYNYSRGIVYEYMNIRYKNYESRIIKGENVIINSPMRIKGGSRENKNWLAGQLVNCFAEAYYLE